MSDTLNHILKNIIDWSNTNPGFLSLLLFVTTILLGWVSGIFKSLIKRPKFQIEVIEGPSLCCTFNTGRKFNNHDTHRTVISLYLSITNIGTASSQIMDVKVGYNHSSLKHIFKWYWFPQRTNALADFGIQIGDHYKVYPFLVQMSAISMRPTDTFLEAGKNVIGIEYFEQNEAWGNFHPRIVNNRVRIKIIAKDIFKKNHSLVTYIPNVELSEARKYNPQFGNTLETLDKHNKDTAA
jgi:hypothetical protein